MTPRQLEILQHALGVDQYGQGNMYRNHFCAGGADEDTCRELVGLGYMRLWPNANSDTGETQGFPYYNCSVTTEGTAAMLRESPKAPKLSRAKRRYLAFLKADTGRSFIEWLRDQRTYTVGSRDL